MLKSLMSASIVLALTVPVLPVAGEVYLDFKQAQVVGNAPGNVKLDLTRTPEGLRVSWPEGARTPLEVMVRQASASPLFALPENPIRLKLKLPDDSAVHHVHLRFRDAGNEIFQYSRVPAIPAEDGWMVIEYPARPGNANVIYGGDKNRQIDWPLRLHSVVLSIDNSARAGEATLAGIDMEAPSLPPEWLSFASGVRVGGVQRSTTTAEPGENQTRLTWTAETPNPIEISVVPSKNLDVPPTGPVMLVMELPENSPVHHVHLRFRDANGEIHQSSAAAAPGRKQYGFDILHPTVIYGGDKNRQIDWPLRFHSVVLSFNPTGQPGEAILDGIYCTPAALP